MSEDDNNVEVTEDELAVLKARADHMGVGYHPNIGLDTLRERVKAKQTEMLDDQDKEQKDADAPTVLPMQKAETQTEKRIRLKNESNTLIRIRVTCMNQNKREWEGEIFTTGNSHIGTFRKYVPFGVEYHVPKIIFTMIEQRECQMFFTVIDPQTRRKTRRGRLIKEYAVEVLRGLNPEELKDLAQRQAMAKGAATV